jgi:hypothetical protein
MIHTMADSSKPMSAAEEVRLAARRVLASRNQPQEERGPRIRESDVPLMFAGYPMSLSEREPVPLSIRFVDWRIRRAANKCAKLIRSNADPDKVDVADERRRELISLRLHLFEQDALRITRRKERGWEDALRKGGER